LSSSSNQTASTGGGLGAGEAKGVAGGTNLVEEGDARECRHDGTGMVTRHVGLKLLVSDGKGWRRSRRLRAKCRRRSSPLPHW
jgi:hypothetical protein